MSGLARSSHHALDFQRNLTRTITLTDGGQVKSLHDARTVLLALSVNARSGALEPSSGKRYSPEEGTLRSRIMELP